jgi:hypothetical protein
MRLNENTAIVGDRVVLVPYRWVLLVCDMVNSGGLIGCLMNQKKGTCRGNVLQSSPPRLIEVDTLTSDHLIPYRRITNG